MNKIESIKKENLNETNNVSSAELFGIKTDFEVPQFVKKADHCPPIDKNYVFDEDTTIAILLEIEKSSVSSSMWVPVDKRSQL